MRAFCGALLLSLVACSTESPSPTVTLPPGHGVRPVYTVPGGGDASGLMFGGGNSFQFTGATAPGSATFTGAVYTGIDEPIVNTGGGSLSITIDGQLYSTSSLESIATTMADDTGEYLVIGGYAHRPGAGGDTVMDQAFIIIPQSDFAPVATIELDGQDRIALFATGPADAEEPELYAAAVTGTVQLGGGSPTAGGTITATVSGDFGAIEVITTDPPGGGGGGEELPSGTYALAIAGPADVYCDGSLAGQEAAFANITTASLGFTDGIVTVTGGTTASVAGAPISAAFGTSELALESIGDGLFAGFSDEGSSGPAGTTMVAKYLVVDAASSSSTFITVGVGAAYASATDDGQCSVAFGVSLTSP